MSPEQFSVGMLDERTDIYSLGVTLFEMLDGKPPWQQETAEGLATEKAEAEPPVDQLNVSDELKNVILTATRVNPSERYRDADAMRAALETVSERSAQVG